MLAMMLGLLLAFLLAAVLTDVTRRRIPNLLVLSGALVAVLCHYLLPDGKGVVSALVGMLLGLAMFLPLYLLRAMGAGDVKLMAMVGAFVGAQDVVGAALGALVIGGIMAIAVAVARKSTGHLMRNLGFMGLDAMARIAAGRAPVPAAPARSVGKLPYAVAIAGGTLAYVLWQHYSRSG